MASDQTMWSRWKKFWPSNDPSAPSDQAPSDAGSRPSLGGRLSRRVVPSLPRAGTFKRQQSELRDNLEPVQPDHAERRAVSVGGKRYVSAHPSATVGPRQSAPDFLAPLEKITSEKKPIDVASVIEEVEDAPASELRLQDQPPSATASVLAGETAIDDEILKELETCWILNLSMHFRDHSKREKFFVTYAETPQLWRRVTISVDYRLAVEASLEWELSHTRYQRDKSALIYEAIRESLRDIQFYPTVTNLKLETQADRLHVHVTEDVHETISYPPLSAVEHLDCRRVREDEASFDGHLAGFVYRVRVGNELLIKKEIPGPNSVDEFLYEINALTTLSASHSVIKFKGLIVDNAEKHVKGLLVGFAEKGALIDVIYDEKSISWRRREKWARQIVQGLSEIHEAGFVQGDFTLSNIVIDEDDNAKIIDINRRGCPCNWEPPEMYPLIKSGQRISLYIGVKSDLWQLGICLWALAMQNDEPEVAPRPLTLDQAAAEVPPYYRDLTHLCLSQDPRDRKDARELLRMFPESVAALDTSDAARAPVELPSGRATEIQYVVPSKHVVDAEARDWTHVSQEVAKLALSQADTHGARKLPLEKEGLEELDCETGHSTTTYVEARSISFDDDDDDDYSTYPSRGRSPAARPVTYSGIDPYIISVSPTGRPGYPDDAAPEDKFTSLRDLSPVDPTTADVQSADAFSDRAASESLTAPISTAAVASLRGAGPPSLSTTAPLEPREERGDEHKEADAASVGASFRPTPRDVDAALAGVGGALTKMNQNADQRDKIDPELKIDEDDLTTVTTNAPKSEREPF